MAAENKRIIVIGIDNSEFAEKSFDCKYFLELTSINFYVFSCNL
jgi:hypothetical protein